MIRILIIAILKYIDIGEIMEIRILISIGVIRKGLRICRDERR